MRAVIFEEHSSVLPHWFSSGVTAATLIYLDAHLDLQFIDESRIAQLRNCTTAAALAQLESTHPLSPDRSACFGIEDFLYPAARLGVLRRVIWVVPPHVMSVGIAMALQGLQQIEGVTVEALESFHRTSGGWIEGRLLGVDLAITDLAQLPLLPLDGCVLVDIDTDYFISVPDDIVWAEPQQVVAVLRELVGTDVDVTIARSVGSGFLPLGYRFLADYLGALWEGRLDESDHWQRLFDLDRQFKVGKRGDAIVGLKLAREHRPDCAATCYALALTLPDEPERTQLLAHAASLDKAYAGDLVRRLGEYRARWKPIDLATVLNLHSEVAALQDSAERQAIAWISLGQLYTDFGRVDEALRCDLQSLRYSAGHPDLALEIAKLSIAHGKFSAAIPLLDRAAADDETRVSAWLLLAECAGALGFHDEACRYALMAHQAAPAWSQVLKRLGVFVNVCGNQVEARRMMQQHEEIERRIGRVVARFA